MKPSVAASEYAGAVEATPMTKFDMKPRASALRPLSPVAMCPSTSGGVAESDVIARTLARQACFSRRIWMSTLASAPEMAIRKMAVPITLTCAGAPMRAAPQT